MFCSYKLYDSLQNCLSTDLAVTNTLTYWVTVLLEYFS